MKTFKRRDSATAVLKKLGLPSSYYNQCITKNGEEFLMDHDLALKLIEELTEKSKVVESIEKPKATKSAEKPKATKSAEKPKATKSAEKPKAEKPKKIDKAPKSDANFAPYPKENNSDYIRRLISDGHGNKEIWAAVKEFRNLDDSKKWYPSWYRGQMRRKGLKV